MARSNQLAQRPAAHGAVHLPAGACGAAAGAAEPGPLREHRERGHFHCRVPGAGDGAHPQPGAAFQFSLRQWHQGGRPHRLRQPVAAGGGAGWRGWSDWGEPGLAPP